MRAKSLCRTLVVAASFALSLPASVARADSGIVLYQDGNFGGRGVGATGDIRDFERFNDAASSVHVKGGVWQLCEHANFEGRCITVDRDVRDLGQLGFNDKVSSVRRIDNRDYRDGHGGNDWRDRDDRHGGKRGDVAIFAGANFAGESKVLNDDVRNLAGSGFNDRISSISIRRGTWRLCEHANYEGRCVTVTGDVPSLSRYGLNDKISSMRRVR